MTNPYYAQITRWRVPEHAIPEILAEMTLDGRAGNEGIVLFLGRNGDDGVADVSYLVRLRGAGITKHPAQITLSAELINDVTDAAVERGVRLIGQVHSHGPGYGVSLSPTDKIYGIQAPFYLSLVAPDYALSGAPLEEWGAHVFMEGRGFVRLNRTEAKRRVELVPGMNAVWVTVGSAHHE